MKDVIESGKDMVPKIKTLRAFDPPKRVADTQAGATGRDRIEVLEKLIRAYEGGTFLEQSGG